uniref:CARD domain-containing protein n=1 Tax=Maylandia zebra TaxID=106582 RepID=A0A3P9C0Q0_9CICH
MAAEELASVRSAFVCRVSPEILTQLLEALVSDGVLNELEKESILEGNPVRADKARCSIDSVRKKGDQACRIMIRHLQSIDLSLFLSCVYTLIHLLSKMRSCISIRMVTTSLLRCESVKLQNSL